MKTQHFVNTLFLFFAAALIAGIGTVSILLEAINHRRKK